MHWKVLLIVSTVTILYVILGGVIFHFIEGSNEEETVSSASQLNGNFLQNFTCISQTELRTFVQAVITAYDSGVLVLDNTTTSNSNWDVASSIFFSWTVITTIGYGHISPSTNGGRSFCCLFAFIGIPLAGILLSGLGEKLGVLSNKVFKKIEPKIKSKKGFTALKIVILTLIILIFLFIIPAAIFTSTEGWTFNEGIYYAFITLTTVGFGDFVAGQNTSDTSLRALQRISLIIWILVGLSVLALVIGELSDLIKSTSDKIESQVVKKKESPADTGNNGKEKDASATAVEMSEG